MELPPFSPPTATPPPPAHLVDARSVYFAEKAGDPRLLTPTGGAIKEHVREVIGSRLEKRVFGKRRRRDVKRIFFLLSLPY